MASREDPTELQVVRPRVARYEDQEILGRRQAVVVAQTQEATVEMQLRRPGGSPVDLSVVAAQQAQELEQDPLRERTPTGCRIRLHEALSSPGCYQEVLGRISNPGQGVLRFELPARTVRQAGVYLGYLGVFQANKLVFQDQLHVLVERSAWGDDVSRHGPFSLAEIQLSLRDSCPEDGYLLESVEHDLAEVCAALVRAVRYYNDSQPPLPQRYTTITFPYAEMWLLGTQARLLEMAAHSYRREKIHYSAAGVALDDKDKAQEYEQLAQLRWQEFAHFVKAKKVEINANAMVGGVGLYRHRW